MKTVSYIECSKNIPLKIYYFDHHESVFFYKDFRFINAASDKIDNHHVSP